MNLDEPRPTFDACPGCGQALHRDELDEHRCDEERQLQLAIRRAIIAFEGELRAWLGTPHGRFAVWLAARDRP
jgi:hypothetical protein